MVSGQSYKDQAQIKHMHDGYPENNYEFSCPTDSINTTDHFGSLSQSTR